MRGCTHFVSSHRALLQERPFSRPVRRINAADCSPGRLKAQGAAVQPCHRASVAAAAAATEGTPHHSELVAAVNKLVQLHQQHAEQAEIDQQADLIAQLSQEAGSNTILPELNDGCFKGYTLSGRTAQRFTTVITLGTLSFNLYQPNNLKIKMLTEGTEGAGVLKGKWEGKDQAYVVTAYFTIVDQGEDGVEGAPVYLKGRSVTIGEYDFVPDHPERISIKFKGMQLEPASTDAADLQRWLEFFVQHNPSMDRATGVFHASLPDKAPEGYLDHLLMIPEYQLLQGNYGSRTLLERV